MSTETSRFAEIRDGVAEGDPAVVFRVLAILSGSLLMAAYLGVFYRLISIANGSLGLFLLVVLGTMGVATVARQLLDARSATVLGLGLFVAGIVVYFAFVPRLVEHLLDPRFVTSLLSYTTGISVLRFLRVDVWATGIAPTPVFLSWFFLLRRRYDMSAIVGGLVLAFFAFTSDANAVTLITGVLGLFGVLAFGTLERSGGSWRQVERLGLVAVLAVLGSRLLPVVPSGASSAISPSSIKGPSLEVTLLDADEQVEILGSISLSPEVRFTVTSNVPSYWHAASYNRYTGDSWLRTGNSRPYDGTMEPPPGRTRRVVQRFKPETGMGSVPGVWKPVEVEGEIADELDVTDLGGLKTTSSLGPIEPYRVVSQMPVWTPETLRATGKDYPDEIENGFLEVPNSLPDRVAEQARAIAGDADTAYDAAVAIEQWLTATKDYSLTINRPNGDIVAGFLFGMNAGYCVYFASAMAIMLRTLDVPTRFSVGYATGQRIGENTWAVRGFDAHAWVDVYFSGVGWVSFDPTPGQGRLNARQQRLEEARQQGESNIEVTPVTPTDTPTSTPTRTATGTWSVTPPGGIVANRSIDLGTISTPTRTGPGRAEIAAGIEEEGTGNGTLTTNTTTKLSNEVYDLITKRDRISLLAGVVGVALGAHHFGLVDHIQKEVWLRHQPPSDSPRADVERAFKRMETLLGRRYRKRASGETPRQYVAALSEETDLDPRIKRVADVYERAQYAGEISRETADEIIEIVDDLVSE